MKVFFNDIKLCVIQNGYFSNFFNIGRGCRQGDPASPYIFLLCVEIMGAMIKKNKNVKGLTISGREYKLLQYADDTALLLDGTEKSLRSSLSLIYQFSKFSGLKPNFQKTSCIRICSLKNTEIVLCKEHKLQWSNDPFMFLGIKFTVDLNNMVELNYKEKLSLNRS